MFRGHGHGNEDNIRMKRNLLTAKHHITEALLNVFISVIFPRTVTTVIVCTVYKYIMNYPAFSGQLNTVSTSTVWSGSSGYLGL